MKGQTKSSSAMLAIVLLSLAYLSGCACRGPFIIETSGIPDGTTSPDRDSVTGLAHGTTFELEQAYHVTSIGVMGGENGIPSEDVQMYIAVIPMPGTGDDVVPAFPPARIENNAIVWGTFQLTDRRSYCVKTDVTLGPGAYAIIVGAGLFGTAEQRPSGDGWYNYFETVGAPPGDLPMPLIRAFYSTLAEPDSEWERFNVEYHMRFSVRGTPAN